MECDPTKAPSSTQHYIHVFQFTFQQLLPALLEVSLSVLTLDNGACDWLFSLVDLELKGACPLAVSGGGLQGPGQLA